MVPGSLSELVHRVRQSDDRDRYPSQIEKSGEDGRLARRSDPEKPCGRSHEREGWQRKNGARQRGTETWRLAKGPIKRLEPLCLVTGPGAEEIGKRQKIMTWAEGGALVRVSVLCLAARGKNLPKHVTPIVF